MARAFQSHQLDLPSLSLLNSTQPAALRAVMASMDQVLLGFPPDDESSLSDEQYHEAIKMHIGRLNQLFRDPFSEVLSSAAQLFQVCRFPFVAIRSSR